MNEALKPFHEWLDQLGLGAWLSAAVIVVAALVLGRLVHLALAHTLSAWTKRTESTLDDKLVRSFRVPIVMTVMLVGLELASGRFALEEATDVTISRVHLTIGLVIWIWFGVRLSSVLLRHASKADSRYRVVEPRTFPLFENLRRVLIVVGGVYVFLNIWAVDATGWLTSAGIVGIVIGLAAKDTLSNLFAGVFIMADAPYRIGDFVVLDQGVRGKVVNIGLRSTRIMTRDDVEITIPNSVIATSQIVNQSGGGNTRMRVRIKLSVSYDADVDEVREILMALARAEPGACDDPEPRLRFRRFGDSGLEYELLFWVTDPADRGRTVDALNTAILKAFRKAGIEIPYPKRDLYIHTQPGGESIG